MQNDRSNRIRNSKLKILGIKNTPISSNSEKQPERLSSLEKYQETPTELSQNTNLIDLNSLFDPTFDENINYSKLITSDRGNKIQKIGKLENFIIRIPKEQKRQILVDLLNKGKKLGNMSISTSYLSGEKIGIFDIPPDLNKFISTFFIEYSPRIKCQLRIATPREKK